MGGSSCSEGEAGVKSQWRGMADHRNGRMNLAETQELMGWLGAPQTSWWSGELGSSVQALPGQCDKNTSSQVPPESQLRRPMVRLGILYLTQGPVNLTAAQGRNPLNSIVTRLLACPLGVSLSLEGHHASFGHWAVTRPVTSVALAHSLAPAY